MDDILLTLDSIYQMSLEEDLAGAIICVDQEKAFDRVNHEYMFTVLEEYGFTGNFMKFIKTMYTNLTSQINVNGKLTKKIKVSRSVRQGWSISMLIFVLTSAPVLNMIEQNKKIKGFKTKYGNEVKALAYADYTNPPTQVETYTCSWHLYFNNLLNIIK